MTARTVTKQLTRRDVALELDIEVNTVDVYRRRTREGKMAPPFPEPDGYLGNRPWWKPEAIAAYKNQRHPGGWHGQERNRLPAA